MKKTLKIVILFFIQLIEKYQYRNIKLDQSDELKKTLNIIPFKDILVETDYGFVPVEEITMTQPYNIYQIELENGLIWEGADNHIIYCKEHHEKFITDLTTDDYLITKIGESKIKSITKLKYKVSMYDLTINGPEPSYYTNEILSHNTVSAAIVILHFVLFNNDKGCMIVANVSSTVKEIVRKIKDIYKLLPFFLKKGVVNWNEKAIAFENGCRIQSANRTKEPAIGFTIDLLYLDEFAKVPANIIEPYYTSVVPTVSSVDNSKIIITSTPDGFNLFHDLLIDAEREDDDPLKGMYTALRVYWWQAKGRRDTKLISLAYKLKEHGISIEQVLEQLREMGYELYEKKTNGKVFPMIRYIDNEEATSISSIRSIRLENNLPLAELFIITNWQEEETKLIGGEDAFKQEYDLQFITGNKLLFDSEQMERFQANAKKFVNLPIDSFDKKLNIPYTNLRWINDRPDLFNIAETKKYAIVASLDLSEGLGQDYTVLNIFRLLPKSKEVIEKHWQKYGNIYDYFQLEQIGMFRSNIYRIDEFAQLFYMIMFELFDQEKCEVVLEYNTYGATLLSELPHVFQDNNNYSNAIFLRYKHRKEDDMPKIGMKIVKGDHEASKKQLIADFQAAIKKLSIIIHNDITVNELRTFSRKDTPSGDFTFQSESGHDDTTMTLVTLASVFKHVHFKNMIDTFISRELSADIRQLIEGFVYRTDEGSIDYNSTSKIHSRVYGKQQNQQKIMYGSPFGSPFGGNKIVGTSPWKR